MNIVSHVETLVLVKWHLFSFYPESLIVYNSDRHIIWFRLGTWLAARGCFLRFPTNIRYPEDFGRTICQLCNYGKGLALLQIDEKPIEGESISMLASELIRRTTTRRPCLCMDPWSLGFELIKNLDLKLRSHLTVLKHSSIHPLILVFEYEVTSGTF